LKEEVREEKRGKKIIRIRRGDRCYPKKGGGEESKEEEASPSSSPLAEKKKKEEGPFTWSVGGGENYREREGLTRSPDFGKGEKNRGFHENKEEGGDRAQKILITQKKKGRGSRILLRRALVRGKREGGLFGERNPGRLDLLSILSGHNKEKKKKKALRSNQFWGGGGYRKGRVNMNVFTLKEKGKASLTPPQNAEGGRKGRT